MKVYRTSRNRSISVNMTSLGRCAIAHRRTGSEEKLPGGLNKRVTLNSPSHSPPRASLTLLGPHKVPSNAGCEVHVYRSRWQCKSRHTSPKSWLTACMLPRPYLSMHCSCASNRSPGKRPCCRWSRYSEMPLSSNKQPACELLRTDARRLTFRVPANNGCFLFGFSRFKILPATTGSTELKVLGGKGKKVRHVLQKTTRYEV